MTSVDELKPFGLSEMNTINLTADEYAKQAAAYRKALQQRLVDQGQEQFKQANPFILEDLNSRGFATSPSETANAQSRYLSDIALKNNQTLGEFDTQAFNEEQGLRQQAAMTPLELERMGIERDYALADQARQEALAKELAKRQSRDSLTSGLLGMGGNILGGTLGGILGGGGGGGAAGGGAAGGAGALSGVGGSILPAVGATAGIAASSYLSQKLGNAIFKSKKAEKRARTGATIGSLLGGLGGGITGQTIGGLTASKPAKAVSKAFKKAFCFVPGTMIEMENGEHKAIECIELGDTVKGGQVYSVRMSIADHGQIFNYLGTHVTGSHAVKENGVWTRVENSAFGIKTDMEGPVISLVTEHHRIHSNGTEFADEFEHDNYEEITMDESLKLLNFKEFAHA